MRNGIRALPPGVIIHKRYQIKTVLGEGGFGITYQAWDMLEGCFVALKEYMPIDIAVRSRENSSVCPASGQQVYYERFRTRFLEEARIIYQFQHPNIISVKHLFYENNTAYYVMEFMQGQDLGKMLRPGKCMDWKQISQILSPVVSALAMVHQAGMIHCDISPENVFIQNDGQVKLIDFGAAKQIMKGQSSVVILKKGYAPPEQFTSSGRLGTWTDIYALAVMIYQMCTGRMPPTAPERLVDDQLLRPSRVGIKIPSQEWEEALMRGMALKPEDRYQDVAQFWKSLNQDLILEGISGTFLGQKIRLTSEMYLGTDEVKCEILYPAGSAGVSRAHLGIRFVEGEFIALDMGSTYGTYLDGKRMKPGLFYKLEPGMMIELGDRQIFRIAETNDATETPETSWTKEK